MSASKLVSAGLLTVAGLLPVSASAITVTVPTDEPQIRNAVKINRVDEVRVRNNNEGNAPYWAFDMVPGVRVIVESGQTPSVESKVDGVSVPYAITFPSGSTASTEVNGLTILSAASDTASVRFLGSGKLSNCSISGNGAQYGLWVQNSSVELDECEIAGSVDAIDCIDASVTATGTGINSSGYGIVLCGESSCTLSGCGIVVPGYGILGDNLATQVTLTGCDISTGGVGINNVGTLNIQDTDMTAPTCLAQTVGGSSTNLVRCTLNGRSDIWESSIVMDHCHVSSTSYGLRFLHLYYSSELQITNTQFTGLPGSLAIESESNAPASAHLKVIDCVFDGWTSGIQQTAGRLFVSGSTFNGGLGAVTAEDVLDFTIEESEFYDQNWFGVSWNTGEQWTSREIMEITGSLFRDLTHYLGIGIEISVPNDSASPVAEREPQIRGNTVVGWNRGMLFSEMSGFRSGTDISNNLITGAEAAGVDFGQIGDASIGVHCNLVYGNGGCYQYGTYEDLFECPNFYNIQADNGEAIYPDTSNFVEPPRFCGDILGTDDFALQIDSPAAEGNSGSCGRIGARDVACAGGTLVRSTVVTGQTVTVLNDVRVPTGMSLSLQPGTVFRFDESDESGQGISLGLNELYVAPGGELQATGATLTSALASPDVGDWFGIYAAGAGYDAVAEQSDLFLDGVDIRYGTKAVVAAVTAGSGPGVTIRNSTLTYHQASAMYFGGTGTVDIQNNYIYPHYGEGITLLSLGGGLIEGNEIFGGLVPSSTNGIHFYSGSTYGSPVQVLNNLLTDWTRGNGIWVEMSTEGENRPIVQNNIFRRCATGVYVSKGSALIGGADTEDGNSFENNAVGLYAHPVGPGSCPPHIGTDVTVRKNHFLSDDQYGILTVSTASVNAGDSTEDGLNIFAEAAWCVKNLSPVCGTVKARGNYYGPCPFGPWCATSALGVDASGFLCEEPASSELDGVSIGELGEPALRVFSALSGPRAIGYEWNGTATVANAEIFDLAGRREMWSGPVQLMPGRRELPWDGRSSFGSRLPAGIHFLRVTTESGLSATAKILVLQGRR